MEKKYFLPINSKSLSHYFGAACIRPAKYFPNKPQDLQDRYPNHLFLSSLIAKKEADCYLEVILTKTEEEQLVDLGNGTFLINNALPITRVKGIFFSNKETLKNTVENIKISTAFIPSHIINELPNFDVQEFLPSKELKDLPDYDLSEKIKSFDQFLGAFALLKLSGEEYMNFSQEYFPILSFFNRTIGAELANSKQEKIAEFTNVFLGEKPYSTLFPYLKKSINEDDVNEVALKEGQIVKKDNITRVIDLKKLERFTYILAVLNTFGVGEESRKKKIDGLILSKFKEEIKPSTSEIVSICIGFNRGYSVFPKKITTSNLSRIVKFQLNSQLDYYTIESLYQYCFNGEKSEEFPYLDKWCPKLDSERKSLKSYEFRILDVVVVGKKKPKVLSEEYLESLLQIYFQKEKGNLFRELVNSIRNKIFEDANEEILEDIKVKQEKDLINEEYKEFIAQKEAFPKKRHNPTTLKINFDNEPEQLNKIQSKNNSFELNEKRLKSEITSIVLNLKKNFNKEAIEKKAKDLNIDLSKEKSIDDRIIKLIIEADLNDLRKP